MTPSRSSRARAPSPSPSPPPSLSSGSGSGSSGDDEILFVKRLSPQAKLPTKGSEFAAGYDLYATEYKCIAAHNYGLVATGIAMAIPYGYYGRIAARSGLASKTGLMVNAGVIDSDYRGEIKVLFNNPTALDVEIQPGDKMAQIVMELIGDFEVEEITGKDELPPSDRGEYGFGSTGN